MINFGDIKNLEETVPWGSRCAGLSMRNMNASFPEFMSDGLDWLPPPPPRNQDTLDFDKLGYNMSSNGGKRKKKKDPSSFS